MPFRINEKGENRRKCGTPRCNLTKTKTKCCIFSIFEKKKKTENLKNAGIANTATAEWTNKNTNLWYIFYILNLVQKNGLNGLEITELQNCSEQNEEELDRYKNKTNWNKPLNKTKKKKHTHSEFVNSFECSEFQI